MLVDGVYGLTIERATVRRRTSESAEALAILRNGRILGSGQLGGTFTGTYKVDCAGQDIITVHITMGPQRELLNGFRSGHEGATIDVEAAFDRAVTVHREHLLKFEIGGRPMTLRADFLGPLPDWK
jgi:hypothetical protein